jgi:4-hydroxybenzoate polyprenyltransferase
MSAMNGSIIQRLSLMGRDIKLAHSVFALPFALLATFMAARWAERLPGADELALIVGCMFFARTFAMLSNRYVDRKIDADNPRTAGRALPSGKLRPREVVSAMIGCVVGLAACAAAFGLLRHNWWPLALSPIAVAWLGGYGLIKRYSAAAHFVLGAALGLSPIGAVIAIEPGYLTHSPAVWLLAGFVVLWVGGFDIIYALQDMEVDQAQGLRSIPAKLGRNGALMAAKAAHLIGLLLLVGVQTTTPAFKAHHIVPRYGVSYFTLSVVIVALLLLWEHRAAKRDQFTMAFFTLNGAISLLVGAAGIVDLLLWH